ncbi:hypothetical protein VP01_32g36 [Puccinia sorghi]|uniref:Uncharacterized protein n=1 Tax=Puccinia sorghi TaxID=27349 RepID=A0A0L6UZD7_9BASI|nr:hypothetical protein VP01_32g36 [Puccinia sorghi]
MVDFILTSETKSNELCFVESAESAPDALSAHKDASKSDVNIVPGCAFPPDRLRSVLKNSPCKGLRKSVSLHQGPRKVGFNDHPQHMGFQDEQLQSHLSGSIAENKFFLKPIDPHEHQEEERTNSVKNLSLADLEERERKMENTHPTAHPVVKPNALDLMASKRFIERTSRMREIPRPRRRAPYYLRKADIIGANQPGNPFWKSAASPRKPRPRNRTKAKKKPPSIKSRRRPFSDLQARNFVSRLHRMVWKNNLPRLIFQQPMLKAPFFYSSLAAPLNRINSLPSGVPS